VKKPTAAGLRGAERAFPDETSRSGLRELTDVQVVFAVSDRLSLDAQRLDADAISIRFARQLLREWFGVPLRKRRERTERSRHDAAEPLFE
jgi:hypothetical protein